MKDGDAFAAADEFQFLWSPIVCHRDRHQENQGRRQRLTHHLGNRLGFVGRPELGQIRFSLYSMSVIARRSLHWLTPTGKKKKPTAGLQMRPSGQSALRAVVKKKKKNLIEGEG